TFFLHRPYNEWHPLNICYVGSGWTVDGEAATNSDAMDTQSFEISRGANASTRLVTYTFFDLNSREWMDSYGVVPEIRSLSEKIRDSISRRLAAWTLQDSRRTDVLSAGLVLEYETGSTKISPEDQQEANELLTMAAD